MARTKPGRLAQRVKRALLHAGRPVTCEVCGDVLFIGVPIIWGGRVKLVGAEQALVRVDFDSMNRLVFSHVELDRCNVVRATGAP